MRKHLCYSGALHDRRLFIPTLTKLIKIFLNLKYRLLIDVRIVHESNKNIDIYSANESQLRARISEHIYNSAQNRGFTHT
jgi:hypothetical protein